MSCTTQLIDSARAHTHFEHGDDGGEQCVRLCVHEHVRVHDSSAPAAA